MIDAVDFEFMRVGSAKHLVAGDLRRDDLADDIVIGKADNETVLGSIVLVFCLGDQALTGIVVGLTGPATFVLGLVPTAAILDRCLGVIECRQNLSLTCSTHCSSPAL